ncbi:MAG TPA: carboxypeptidase-like regulatory domain-containing protein, partial [Planctomycetota bacterium]|nr:carboxypeptidase-like regulatory domain-containing protein [Planctomycetota bacterium]
MAKKVLVSVSLAVILLLGVGGGLLWRSRSPREDKAPQEPLAEPVVVNVRPAESPQPEASTETAAAPRSAAVLPPYAELRGVVLHENGAPLAGARVKFVDSIRPEEVKDLTERGFPDVREGKVSHETLSNGGGEFTFRGLLPDGGHVSAEKESVYMFGMVRVELKAGEASWKELRLQDLLRVTGSIRDKEGAVPVGGLVFLQEHQVKDPPMKLGSIDYREFGGFPADASGGYDSGFRLTIQKGHHAPLFAWAEGHAIATREIQLSDFNPLEARVDFELVPELPVSVLVTTPDGRPVEGAEVGLGKEDGIFSSDFPYPAAFTDSRGRARLEHLAPREQPIRAAMEGYHAASINVGPGGPEVFHITLQPLGHPITGRVVFEGDSRLPRQAVRVSLVHMNGEDKSKRLRAFNETSDKEAFLYTYRPRGPGRYRFEYRHGDDDYQTEPFDYTGAEPVEVKLPVELKLQPPYVSGIVLRSESGEPLPDAVVEAHYFPRGKEPLRWGGGAFIHLGHQRNHFFPPPPGRVSEARSGADGRFLIPLPREGGSTVILQARSNAVWWHGPENEKLWWSEEVVLDVAETDAIADIRMEVK